VHSDRRRHAEQVERVAAERGGPERHDLALGVARDDRQLDGDGPVVALDRVDHERVVRPVAERCRHPPGERP
jgi:hypothetical protein